MAWAAQWRTKGESNDAVLVLDERGKVQAAIPATQSVLSRLLTEMGDLATWRGESSPGDDPPNPETWGQLVISRAISGEVIEVEPELFWHGIYSWFRAHGVDYDTPGLKGSSLRKESAPKLSLSALMDD